jgi:M3 family oligoendopeptidase
MVQLQHRFSEIPYKRPDLDELQATYNGLREKFSHAATAESMNELIREWNNIRVQFDTQSSIAHVRNTLNVKDEAVRAEKEFFDNNAPTVAEWDTEIARLVLASPFGEAIAAEWGALFLARLQERVKTFSSAIKPLLVEESKLVQQYADLLAEAQIEFDGETYNLASIDPLCLSPDRDIRKRANQAKFGFFAANSEKLDAVYDQLVKLRCHIAETLGFNNYIEYRYMVMGRTDYNASDVARFRSQVAEAVVPITVQLRQRQAERLGVEKLYMHDEGLQFPEGNPNPQGDPNWILSNAVDMYHELSPVTGEFFDMMTRFELMDLVTRNNKEGGGYCTSFPLYGVPFIFSNFNGTTHDVEVLTHEAGHAFQMYMSREQKLLDYIFPTAEACEIHSMSMEFLTWPWMDRFFREQTENFKFYHLQGALLFLPYSCTVDEFQHWVYENPDATPAERNAQWHEIEQKYMPLRAYDDIPYAEAGGIWQRQAHIYAGPFYYIDYALAQICALQFWSRAEKDREKALEDYINICKVGGSMTFLEIVAEGNLISPFREGCLESIVGETVQWLENWKEKPVYDEAS